MWFYLSKKFSKQQHFEIFFKMFRYVERRILIENKPHQFSTERSRGPTKICIEFHSLSPPSIWSGPIWSPIFTRISLRARYLQPVLNLPGTLTLVSAMPLQTKHPKFLVWRVACPCPRLLEADQGRLQGNQGQRNGRHGFERGLGHVWTEGAIERVTLLHEAIPIGRVWWLNARLNHFHLGCQVFDQRWNGLTGFQKVNIKIHIQTLWIGRGQW